MELNQIYNESCLETLARMPDGFLDCVVTSPPYYGLRSYGTEPQIWGGSVDCQHVFVTQTITDKRGKEGSTLNGRDPNQDENRLNYEYAFCAHCNAWRGELGLEPTFQQINHELIKQCDTDALHIEAVELGLPGFAEIELKYAADYLNETSIHSSDIDRNIFNRILKSPFFISTINGMDSIGVSWFAHALMEAQGGNYRGFLNVVKEWNLL